MTSLSNNEIPTGASGDFGGFPLGGLSMIEGISETAGIPARTLTAIHTNISLAKAFLARTDRGDRYILDGIALYRRIDRLGRRTKWDDDPIDEMIDFQSRVNEAVSKVIPETLAGARAQLDHAIRDNEVCYFNLIGGAGLRSALRYLDQAATADRRAG